MKSIHRLRALVYEQPNNEDLLLDIAALGALYAAAHEALYFLESPLLGISLETTDVLRNAIREVDRPGQQGFSVVKREGSKEELPEQGTFTEQDDLVAFKCIMGEIFSENIDYVLLHKQKIFLLALACRDTACKEKSELIQGIVNLIDEIIDAAIDRGICRVDDEGNIIEHFDSYGDHASNM